MFKGHRLKAHRLDEEIVEICFDNDERRANSLDASTIEELEAVTRAVASLPHLQGILVTSAKESFISGLDVAELRMLSRKPMEQIERLHTARAAVITRFASLPVPVVVAIKGSAHGAGLALALAADHRVMGDQARVACPETDLGLIPAFGGTVWLPRICGTQTAIDWIASSRAYTAAEALTAGVVDRIASDANLEDVALELLHGTIIDRRWVTRRAERDRPATPCDDALIRGLEQPLASEAAPGAVRACIDLILESAQLDPEAASRLESRAFAQAVRADSARALMQVALNEHSLRAVTATHLGAARRIERAGVVGAGIMGGGIAFAGASSGIPVLMKDIVQDALDAGKRECARLLDKAHRSGRLDPADAQSIDARIVTTLDYDDFNTLDVAVEAVVENLAVKKRVLAEMEARARPTVVLASNSSSLSIDELASALERPERFVGMHFFNPVPVMPLVEVIRSRFSSDEAIATLVSFAARMGKVPVVLSDCPGFLVNRILNAYFVGFSGLIRDGADFAQIDAVMQRFGWPMGPAHLQDVIGMDTSSHVFELIAGAYPQRMSLDFVNPMRLMADRGRYGQKSGIGFYRYERAPGQRPARKTDAAAWEILAAIQREKRRDLTEEEIVDRMMLPMIVEAATCLVEGIARSAGEIDMALILGLGFPRDRGGALAYADAIGFDSLRVRCDRYASLGAAYQLNDRIMERFARNGFYD